MKPKFFPLSLLILTSCSYASMCPDLKGISAPQWGEHSQAYYPSPEKVCLDGRDISNEMKKYPDDKITGAFSMVQGDGGIFFVSVYSEDHYHGRVLLLADIGGKAKAVTLYQNVAGKRSEEPEKSVENLTINYFDNKTATLYYSADAWAQAGAVHALKWTNLDNVLSVDESFIHDGTFEGVYNGMPMVSSISHDKNGAYFPSYLIRDNGTIFCTINTRESGWQLSPACLDPRDDYRPR
ncbi:hypothetical protein AAIO65_09530 [Erwinia amylovora]|uniref:hypothetical protein n=1 Tax=Erwinia amylovora TaxID=552 RepID=UPI0014446505|nr:hypothetical protein [Erwinia amylovora]